MLAALERGELLERDENGGYVAGSLFWHYAARHDPWEQLVRIARPAMERVGSDTQESVHLSVLRGDRVVQVAQVDSQYLLGTRDWTQVDVPAAHLRARQGVLRLGRALAASAVERAGAPHARHPHDRGRARARRGETRRRGYRGDRRRARGRPDRHRRYPSAASHDEVVAALGISGPTSRLDVRVEELGRNLITRATEVVRGPAWPTLG